MQMARWLGIERTVVTIGNAHQGDNRCLLEVLRNLSIPALGVAAISADISSSDLSALQEQGIVGARIMDLPGGAVPFSALEEIDKLTKPRDMMIAVQFDGNTLSRKFDALNSVRSRFVIDHHGKFFRAVKPDGLEVELLKRLLDKGNCWFKFAGCYESSEVGAPGYDDVAAIAEVVSDYAPERIVWGTNWPHNSCPTTESYPDDMGLLDLALSWIAPKHHQRVLVTNPEELYGFSKS
jgi:D-galactarolactone isomerase